MKTKMKKDRYIIFCDGRIDCDFIATNDEAKIYYESLVNENIADTIYDEMECVLITSMGKDKFKVI